jgi:tetrahydromethanopterin S-methyltransferase subunit E
MFDPLSGALTYLLTEGIKKLVAFLKEKFGFNLVVDGWLALAVAAFVSAALAWSSLLGEKLPTDVLGWIPVVVKVVLILLESVGIHAFIKKLAMK